jgi:hypothetical protein
MVTTVDRTSAPAAAGRALRLALLAGPAGHWHHYPRGMISSAPIGRRSLSLVAVALTSTNGDSGVGVSRGGLV